jgi:hypothetical protein
MKIIMLLDGYITIIPYTHAVERLYETRPYLYNGRLCQGTGYIRLMWGTIAAQ